MKKTLKSKMLAAIAGVLILVGCMTISEPVSAQESDSPSSWAEDRVNEAISKNLVPQTLRANYTQAITRAEFCALAVRLYESVKGEIDGRITFLDTDDINVEKMAYAGVVSGVGNNRFDPDGTLTREQAAVMLSQLAKAIIGEPLATPRITDFYDMNDISTWAIGSVRQISGAGGIMGGVGDNRFAPQQSYTREQSIVTIMRLLDHVRETTDLDTSDNDSASRQSSYEAGRVVVVSNDTEHEPHEHFLHGGIMTEGGFLSASGIPFLPGTIVNALDEIRHNDSLQVVIKDARYASSIAHSLYAMIDDDFEYIYSVQHELATPAVDMRYLEIDWEQDAGVYLLYVDIVWSNLEDDLEYREFTRMRYVFKVRLV